MTTDVPTALTELGNLYRERGAVYGNDYKEHGLLMLVLFPEGMKLISPADFNRYAVFKHLVTKMSRYAKNFHKGGHKDSLDDISVYAQMLRELDDDGT